MATPKAIQGVSTPKNPHISTPSRPNASPRPNTGSFANKTLAYKSPAVKTPTSFHGHSHRISASSHPTSTPLAAPAIHDELLNLNSPAAALIASIGNTGLTPIATGQDGLGITTGITSQTVRDMPLPPRNPETERVNRLEQIAKLLKTKVAGRAVTRDGVERVAQIQGFTHLWDEDNITIAGNSVDLEITFDGHARDTVKDVQLRLNTSGSDEPQLQRNASAVLKKHLLLSAQDDAPTGEWLSLTTFSEDLEYLSQIDYADGSTNCFELMSGLYRAFQTIWEEEERRMRDRPESYRLCQSNVGRPDFDGSNGLGLTTQFWTDRQTYRTLMPDVSLPLTTQDKRWVAKFSCEKGSPGIIPQQNWLEEEPLNTTVTTEDVFQESQIEKPNWAKSDPIKRVDEQSKDADDMLLDGPESGNPHALNLTFVCQLETAVTIPVSMVTALNSQYPVIQIDQSRASTYPKALLSAARPGVTEDWDPSSRWIKKLPCFDDDAEMSMREHSYSLFANGSPWIYPVKHLSFSHPKQYADTLPVLRQYALLWSILRKTLGDRLDIRLAAANSSSKTSISGTPAKGVVRRRTNKKPAQGDLEELLTSRLHDATSKIDLSLDLVTDMSIAKLGVIIPVFGSAAYEQVGRFVHIIVEVRRNGLIEVPAIHGISSLDEDKMKRKAARVLALSEDLSVLVEWIKEEVRKKT